MPVRILVTQGTTADYTQVGRLIEGIDADHLLADRGYDSNAIIEQAEKQVWKLLFLQRRTGRRKDIMIKRCINLGILSKMLFFISKGGVALLQDTPKALLLSLPPYKLDVSPFGRVSCDYII